MLSLSLSCLVDLLDKVSKLGEVVAKRSLDTSTPSQHYVYPGTSRSVERMFSQWKRLLDRNANTRASTMRALCLLSCFDYDEILSILGKHPTTDKIQKFADGLLISERRKLDEMAFNKLQHKTQEEKDKVKRHNLFAEIRTSHLQPSEEEFGRKHTALSFLHLKMIPSQ